MQVTVKRKGIDNQVRKVKEMLKEKGAPVPLSTIQEICALFLFQKDWNTLTGMLNKEEKETKSGEATTSVVHNVAANETTVPWNSIFRDGQGNYVSVSRDASQAAFFTFNEIFFGSLNSATTSIAKADCRELAKHLRVAKDVEEDDYEEKVFATIHSDPFIVIFEKADARLWLVCTEVNSNKDSYMVELTESGCRALADLIDPEGRASLKIMCENNCSSSVRVSDRLNDVLFEFSQLGAPVSSTAFISIRMAKRLAKLLRNATQDDLVVLDLEGAPDGLRCMMNNGVCQLDVDTADGEFLTVTISQDDKIKLATFLEHL